MLRIICIGSLLITTTAAPAAVVVTVLPNLGASLGSEGSYPVDFDGDGIYEVNFVASGGTQFSAFNNTHVRLQAIPANPPNVGSKAVPLNLGSLVGGIPNDTAIWYNNPVGGSSLRVCTDMFCVGNWPTGTFVTTDPVSGYLSIFPESGYLGVEFTNQSGIHYGWVDVGVIGFAPVGRIYGWGWETQPGVSVQIIPEPTPAILTSVGTLAAIFRRRVRKNNIT